MERIVGTPAAAAARAIAASPSGWAMAWAAIGARAIGSDAPAPQERPGDVDRADVGQDAVDEPEVAPRSVVLGQGDLVPRAAGDVVPCRAGHPRPPGRLELVEADDRGELVRTEAGRPSADEVEAGERGEHGLAPDLGVLEGDRDLLVGPGQLRGDDDAVAPAGVADAVAVAVAPLAGDDRPGARERLRRPASPAAPRSSASSAGAVVPGLDAPRPECPRSGAAGERLALRARGRGWAGTPRPAAGPPGRPLPSRKAPPPLRIGVPKRVAPRPKTRLRSSGASASVSPAARASRGPLISSPGISRRNRDGSAIQLARSRAASPAARRGTGTGGPWPGSSRRRRAGAPPPSRPRVGVEAGLGLDRPARREEALLEAGDEHDRELEALRRVERDQRQLVGVGLVRCPGRRRARSPRAGGRARRRATGRRSGS